MCELLQARIKTCETPGGFGFLPTARKELNRKPGGEGKTAWFHPLDYCLAAGVISASTKKTPRKRGVIISDSVFGVGVHSKGESEPDNPVNK